MEWISVNDRLPEIDQNVLLFTDSGIIEGCRIDSKYGEWNFISLLAHGCGCCSSDEDIVTYWMPLPEPPKKE